MPLQPAAKTRDMRLDRAVVDIGAGTVDMRGQLRLGHHAPAPLEQAFQRGNLAPGHIERRTLEEKLPAGAIEDQVAQRIARSEHQVLAPRQRPQPGLQLVHLEGFRQVVVSAGVQPRHALAGFAPGGQQDHRRPVPARAQRAEHREPVHRRQVDVEHQQVRSVAGHEIRAFEPVVEHVHRVAPVPEPVGDAVGELHVVFDDGDPHD